MEEGEDILIAVVIADSFNSRFAPITLQKPRCLLPLLNVPLIEYTLEFLSIAGVDEIYVVCCSHAEQIINYLDKSRWSHNKNVKIIPIVSPQSLSVGDALRDMDAKQLLKTDFILVTGDVISNMNLKAAIDAHKKRKLTDKNSIMTMVLKEASPNHRSQAKGEQFCLVLDADNAQCLHYEPLEPVASKKKVKVELDLLKGHEALQFRNDLIDCCVDICSIDVPLLFTDNFDYQDIRKDFVKGILESDLLGKSIYTHILTKEYAARVKTTQLYDSISRDIFGRWAFPIVPDTNMLGGTFYVWSRPNIYKDRHVRMSRSAILEKHVVIGASTEIGSSTRICNSVIGKNCKIGKNVQIDGAYLWDGVVVKDGCNITRSILADGVVLENNVIIGRGCVLSFDVNLGPDVILADFSRVSAWRDEDEDKHEAKTPVGNGYYWDEEKTEFEDDTEYKIAQLGSIGRDLDSLKISTEEYDEGASTDEGSDSEDEENDNHQEILDTLERSFKENHSIENAVLELNTLKMALNIRFDDIRAGVIPTLLDRLASLDMAGVYQVLDRWGGLLNNFVHNDEDVLDCLNITESCCLEKDNLSKAAGLMVRYFYEKDLYDEEEIVHWFKNANDKIVCVSFRNTVKPFIEWLEQSDEEDDGDSSD